MRGNRSAINMLVQHNLPLVIHFAKRYQNRGLLIPDLVAEGNLGLIRAAERYNIKKKTRFSTYASIWIKQALGRAIENKSRLLKVPVYAQEGYARFVKADDQSYMLTGQHLDIKKFKKARFSRFVTDSSSLNIKTIPLLDSPEFMGPNAKPVYRRRSFINKTSTESKQLINLENADLLEKLIACLSDEEEYILLGLGYFTQCDKDTIKEVAEHLGLSVSVIKSKMKRIKFKLQKYYIELMEK